MLRFGPEDGPLVVAAMPLFEEANRTRTFVVELLRALAARGIGSVLPDLPGTGESLIATAKARLTHWRAGFRACVAAIGPGRCIHGVAIRGGALIDDAVPLASRWHLAPAPGASLLRDLRRASLVRQGQGALDEGNAVDLAGERLNAALVAELAAAVPARSARLRIVRLGGDPEPADLRVAGTALWRLAEPRGDPALATSLADDISIWVARCDG